MQRSLNMLFALVCLCDLLRDFLYLVAFAGNIAVVPTTVDVGPRRRRRWPFSSTSG